MAKLSTMFFVLMVLQLSMLIYVGSDPQSNTLWDFLLNSDNWMSLSWLSSWTGIALAIGLVGITSGSVFGFKTDFLTLAAVISGLLSIGAVFTQLAGIIRNYLVSIFQCSSPAVSSCGAANFIIMLTVAPLAFYYSWTVLEWWRSKDM